MTQPTQVLPYWLSASTTFVTTEGTVFPTTVVVNLPQTYYGPSIPLGPGWVFGGSTSPPPGATLTSATGAASSVAAETPSPSASELTSGASETASATASPSSFATSSGIPISVSSGATPASSVPSTSPPESSASASPSSVTGPLTSTPSISLSSSSITPTSRSSASVVDACTTLFGCSTPTPTTTATAESSNSHKLSTGAIVAIALVSAIAAAILLACCIVIFLRRRRRRSPNHGSPLEGNISALPPPLGDERGSLLAGRRSGGESPDLEGDGATTVYRDAPPAAAADDEVRSEEEDLTHLPIANKYIAQRRSSDSWASRPNSRAAGSLKGRDAERGAYHAVGDTEAAAEVAGGATVAAAAAGAAATAASAHQAGQGSGSSASHAHTHSSRGLFYASGASNGEEHHRAPSPTSGGSHENAEVVTAQRATRSPLARLARLSWFARNRNTASPGIGARGLQTDSDEEGGWVNLRSTSQQMREQGGQPLTTPLLSQPPSGGGRVPIVTRQVASRSNTALVDPPQSPPPPVAFFNVPRSRSAARRSGQSGRSSQSGQTVFFDAEEEPTQAPAPVFMPRTSTEAPALTFTPPATAVPAVQPQRSSLPPSGSESSRDQARPTAADFPVPPAALSPSLSYQWPQFRNSDSQNNDSASLSATSESPIPPGQALPGLYSRSLSGVGIVGAPIVASRGDTLDPPEEERRRHASAPNLREQALAVEENSYRGRLSTLAESTSDSWRARALSPVAASAAAAISGVSGGDERSRRMTLGPASFVDTPQVVDQSDVASLRGDVHSSYTGNGTNSNRGDASYPSRNGAQGGTMATHSTFSTGPAQRRLAPTPHRQPSLSAIGGRPLSLTSDTAAGTGSDSGTGTGTGSGTGGSSAQQSPQSVRVVQMTELGELRPPRRAAAPPSLAIVGERMRPSIDTPPPPPSANPDREALSPPPPRPWWRPYP
ncbi:hypothetical protein FS837_002586 [Tulasnella sp. UAMH 9824]|nr:hypothetical protein FS837_002586 [Tulasnella sp. UAMH 9824]